MINIMLLEPLLTQTYSKHCDESCHSPQGLPPSTLKQEILQGEFLI